MRKLRPTFTGRLEARNKITQVKTEAHTPGTHALAPSWVQTSCLTDRIKTYHGYWLLLFNPESTAFVHSQYVLCVPLKSQHYWHLVSDKFRRKGLSCALSDISHCPDLYPLTRCQQHQNSLQTLPNIGEGGGRAHKSPLLHFNTGDYSPCVTVPFTQVDALHWTVTSNSHTHRVST